ncbi:high nitrogen upregulated cytochrome P450 monooxygenase 2 [Schizopora paradoxa]|uniref:High nitrogen upregulated cytochrome P450 monooxygenase 2 n=1 Tax=Schizopora paradoxa TaxID=27342 RepID=A0A0H2RIP3_9AGAM|nr:high nitrogen upregulated cytochrome P450 monooxygenase 2 [Schizopora paradoxa]
MPVVDTYDGWRLPVLTFKESLLLAATFALIVHAIYKRYETQPSSYVQTFLLLIFPPIVCAPFYLQTLHSLWISLFVSFSAFHSMLVTSIIAYRLSPMHPLYQYPGPLVTKVSKLWMMYVTSTGKMNEYVKSLHDQYGPYVRLGPNEISCIDTSVFQDIFGPSGMPKGPVWDARRNPDIAPSLISLRDLHEHARQRKAWNRAFSTAAVKDYEPIVAKRVLQLAEVLEKESSEGAIDLARQFGYFAFDFMGDMAFGGGFELMRDGDKDGLWHLLEARVRNLAPLIHIPWATRLLLKIPSITGSVKKFRDFTVTCARRRKESGSSTKDLYYHLTNEEGAQVEAPTIESNLSNGELAVVAGSDTTANALCGVFYYLLKHPHEHMRLREEVDRVFPRGEGDAVDASKLAVMYILNAVINETLRLQPGVPTYTERAPAKDSDGHWVGKRFIAEGTAVVCPIYTIHRDPANFSPYPNDFKPDRWLFKSADYPLQDSKSTDEKCEWHTNASALMPFSIGPANCAGKNLALAEMRAAVAVLVQRFDMKFADGYDVGLYEKNVEDRFITQVGELCVSLSLR